LAGGAFGAETGTTTPVWTPLPRATLHRPRTSTDRYTLVRVTLCLRSRRPTAGRLTSDLRELFKHVSLSIISAIRGPRVSPE